MIGKGSTVVLRTINAIYSTCQIVTMSDGNITVSYVASVQRDRETGQMLVNHRTKTIPRREIVLISERL